MLVVPIGGGGLISGMALAAKALKPGIEVFGVETHRFPSMYCALKGTTPQFGTSDDCRRHRGQATRSADTAAGARARERDLLVDEGDIEQAIVLLLEIEKTVVEGAGAAGLACAAAASRTLPRSQSRPRAVRRQHRSAACCPTSSSAAWCAPAD